MSNIFQKTSAHWAKYSEYEYRQGKDKTLYIIPAPKAEPVVYDPLKNAETMVIDALNVGRLAMKKGNIESKLKQAVLDFVNKYGLLGFMTALPTTPDFMDYESVYLPKNHFIKAETMTTQDYVALYYPFDKPDFYKDEYTAEWHVRGNAREDRKMMALAMAFSHEPMAMNMCLQPIYAEPYEWLVQQFQDWAFMLMSCYLYYEDYDKVDEDTRELYRNGVSAFGGIAPTYRISLYRDKPRIVWEFHSLLRGIQMMFSFALTDEARPLRLCKHCTMAFAAGHPNAEFCDPKCKNQYNVYKSRGKK
jgi:hypothetical protein